MKILLYNALIQTHFDYGCTSRSPLLNKNLKYKLQEAQKNASVFVQVHTSLSHRLDSSSKNKFASCFWKSRILHCNCCKYIETGLYHHISMIHSSLLTKAIYIPVKIKYRTASFIFPWTENVKYKSQYWKCNTTASFAHALKRNFSKLCGLTS